MRLTVIGSSPAWPNPDSAHAGYVVESAGTGRLLLDCGPGVLARLRSSALLPVDAIAISHLHLDHWGDLVPWVWMRYSIGDAAPPALWVPPGASEQLAAFGARFAYEDMFAEAFALSEYVPGEPFAAAGFELEALSVEHFDVPAYGFRVRDGDGRTLSYSGDTGPCDALAELARGADLFLCEATLASAAEDANPRGHLAADEALAIEARRTLLTHRPVELAMPPGAERVVEGAATTV